MFKEFPAAKDKMLQVMDETGTIVAPKWKPDISDTDILKAYRFMVFARLADQMAVSFQRQGRMYTYPPNLGQEAIQAAAGRIIQKNDWLIPAFRELGAWLLKGAKLRDIFAFWGGYEDGARFTDAPNILPPAVPIGSQLPHALGIAFALRYRGKRSVAFAFVGDGGTSQGDFHEALNFAGVWRVPLVVIIQNNQYAISLPIREQTAAKNLSVKGLAYGIPGLKVDGNDYLAMVSALQHARENARKNKGPVLIEGVTYRRGAHTTSDDPTLYRSVEEEKAWEARDPLVRLQAYLASRGLWHEKDDRRLLTQYRAEVEKEFAEYERHPAYSVEEVFKYQYKEMPDDLKKQLVEYEKFLNRKEARK